MPVISLQTFLAAAGLGVIGILLMTAWFSMASRTCPSTARLLYP